jgi:hypothetical protein
LLVVDLVEVTVAVVAVLVVIELAQHHFQAHLVSP